MRNHIVVVSLIVHGSSKNHAAHSNLELKAMPKVCGIPQVHFWNLALFVLCVDNLPDCACVLVCAVACASCVRRTSQLITCKK